MAKIILKNFLSPGDVLVMTSALRDLHATYPGEYQTDVRTSCDAIFENSPHITKLNEKEADVIKIHYPRVHQSGWMGCHFSSGYVHYLSGMIGKNIIQRSLLPEIWISDKEKSWINQVEEDPVTGYEWITHTTWIPENFMPTNFKEIAIKMVRSAFPDQNDPTKPMYYLFLAWRSWVSSDIYLSVVQQLDDVDDSETWITKSVDTLLDTHTGVRFMKGDGPDVDGVVFSTTDTGYNVINSYLPGRY